MKDIKGYEGEYAITSCGRIWSYKTNRFRKTKIQRDGYELIELSHLGVPKTYQVHRLVAEAYIPNPDNLPQVNHKDEVKTNNYVNNLEWCDQSYNQKYSYERRKGGDSMETCLNAAKQHNCKKVRCIETGIIYESGAEAARAMGLDASHISKVCRGKLKTHKGFHFEFVMEETE